MSAAADRHLDNVVAAAGLRGGVVATLRAIARYTPDDVARCCYAGEATLARSSGQDVRTVRRHLAALSNAGIVVRRRHAAGAGRGRKNDEIRLVGFNDQPDIMSGWSQGLTGQSRPTNRTTTPDQPDNDDTHIGTGESGDSSSTQTCPLESVASDGSGQVVENVPEGGPPFCDLDLRPPVVSDADRQWAMDHPPANWDAAATAVTLTTFVADQAERFESFYAYDRKLRPEWSGLWRRGWWPRADPAIRYPTVAPRSDGILIHPWDAAWDAVLATLTKRDRDLATAHNVFVLRHDDRRLALLSAADA